MKQHKSKVAMAIIAMLISSYASAQVSDQQIKDFFASNPTPEQIAAAAASLGMNASQISAAMGVANYGGSQAARDAAINSWVGNQANGYTWNAQGQVVKGAAPSVPDPVGVNQASLEKGVWSPVERRWITNDELRAFGATNPSQEQMMQQAIKQGLNPQSIDYAAYVISGAKDWHDQKYGELVNKLNNSMYTGQYGYGYAEDYSQGAALVKGNGAVHYKMPDGSEVSVRMHNGVPDQSYAQALAEHNAMKLQSGSGSNASVPIPVPQSYAQQGWPQSNQNSATANANSQQGAPQIDPSVAMAAASSVVGPSKNQICPAGMTVTMTHSGIRKCVGTMIREKPLQITPPKVSSQQPGQTQQPIYIHPPLPPVRVETIQAHEYVGGQNGASLSTQGFIAPPCAIGLGGPCDGTGGLETQPEPKIPAGYVRAEPNWPEAIFIKGIGWIVPNGKQLMVDSDGLLAARAPGGIGEKQYYENIRKWVRENGKDGVGIDNAVADAMLKWGVTPKDYVNAMGERTYEYLVTTNQMPNGYIRAEPNWPGARLVEGLGWIMPNGKAPYVENGTGGLERNPNIPGPGLGAGGPNPGYTEGTGGLEPNPDGPGHQSGFWNELPAKAPVGPGGWLMPGMRQIPNGYIRAESNWPGATFLEGIGWIAPNGKAPAIIDRPWIYLGGLGMGAGGPNQGFGQNGTNVFNGPGLGAGGPNPNFGNVGNYGATQPYVQPGTGGLEPNPNSGNQWIIGGSGGMKPEAR